MIACRAGGSGTTSQDLPVVRLTVQAVAQQWYPLFYNCGNQIMPIVGIALVEELSVATHRDW